MNSYPSRHKQNISMIKWLYRLKPDYPEPLYLLYNDKIIGQAGLIPNEIILNSKKYIAIWFVDFIISEEYKRKGLGTILAKKWMNLEKIKLTACNDSSLSIFRKAGWKYNKDIIAFSLPINLYRLSEAYNYIKILKFIFCLINPIYKYYLKESSNNIKTQIKNINEISVNEICGDFESKGNGIVRDKNWVKWRLFGIDNNIFRIKLNKEIIYFRYIDTKEYTQKKIKRLHILYQTKIINLIDCKKLLRDLINYSIQNEVDLIYACTNNKALIDLYSALFTRKKPTNFAFQLDDQSLNDEIENSPLNIQAIDSDYDTQYGSV